MVGVNKDSYVILEKLPAEYDSRVKAMEVDERPTEDYTDIGMLPMLNRLLLQSLYTLISEVILDIRIFNFNFSFLLRNQINRFLILFSNLVYIRWIGQADSGTYRSRCPSNDSGIVNSLGVIVSVYDSHSI